MDHSKTLKNILIVSFIGGLTAIIGYVLRAYIARTYTISEYGLLYAIIAFFSLIIVVADMGLFQAVIKRISELRRNEKQEKNRRQIGDTLLTYLSVEILFSLAISIVLIILSKWISNYFFHSGQTFLFMIMILWFLTTPFTTFIGAYYLSYEKTTSWAIFELAKIFYILGLTVVLTNFHVGLISVFISYASVYSILFLLFAIINNKFFFENKLSFNIKTLYPTTFKYGLFILINSLLFNIIIQSDTIILTYIKGLESVGIYQAAIPLASILLLAVTPLSSVMLSSIANLWAKKKKDSVGEIVLLIQKYTIIVFLPITLTLVLYSNMIIPLVFGNKFISAAPILTILAFAYMFLAISIVLVYILTAIGSAKQVTYIMLAMSGLAIILNAILIYFKGAIGAAVAVLITNIVLLTLLTLLASKKIIIKPPLVPWIKTVVASGLFFGAIYLARKIFIADVYMKAGACIAIAIVVYVISLFLLKVLTAKELRYFKKMF